MSSWDRCLQRRVLWVGELSEHLAFDVLPQFSPDETKNPAIPSVCEQAARFLSDWVGAQMRHDFRLEDRWQQLGYRRYAQQLMRILEQCVALLPDRPESWFRLGALACFLGEESRALEAFRRGAIEAPKNLLTKRVGGCVLFEQTIKFNIRGETALAQELAWARAAAHAASALAVGDKADAKRIQMVLSSDVALVLGKMGTVPAVKVINVLVDN